LARYNYIAFLSTNRLCTEAEDDAARPESIDKQIRAKGIFRQLGSAANNSGLIGLQCSASHVPKKCGARHEHGVRGVRCVTARSIFVVKKSGCAAPLRILST
jgi:hypothetical protein